MSSIGKVKHIAIVGEGVIGVSTALALKQRISNAHVTLFSDRDFTKTCSFGPAGIFRIDNSTDQRNKQWARKTFQHFVQLNKTQPPEQTGVKLISGFIQSDNEDLLKSQEDAMSDIVFNFHWLNSYELNTIFVEPSRFAIHFTTFSSEGRRYVPWLRKQLEKHPNVQFRKTKLNSLSQITNGEHGNFDAVVNCAGLHGGSLAGDDDSVYPVRGVAFEVKAGWHKHFNYRDLDTFTIPMNDSVILGTLKQSHRDDPEITDEDRRDIWARYTKLDPAFKDAEVISEWLGFRPARPTVRLEHTTTLENTNGSKCHIIHNYGHASNGFTLSWGCALNTVDILTKLFDSQ